MKTAISIPDPLFEAAERLARRLGISRSQLIQRAVRSLIEAHDEVSVTRTLDQVYSDPSNHSGVDPQLLRMQGASVVRDSW